MKKNVVAVILSLACVFSLNACSNAQGASSEEEPVSSEEELDINGVWQNDKTQDSWIVIENVGQDWSLYNYLGDVAVKGNMYISGDYFDLRDENDETYIEIELIDAKTIMDVTYQETYTKVPSLPDTFPGESE